MFRSQKPRTLICQQAYGLNLYLRAFVSGYASREIGTVTFSSQLQAGRHRAYRPTSWLHEVGKQIDHYFRSPWLAVDIFIASAFVFFVGLKLRRRLQCTPKPSIVTWAGIAMPTSG